MVKEVYIETMKKLYRSSKTKIFLLFVLIAVVIYTIVILPAAQPMQTVDMERMDLDMQANRGIMEDRARSGKTEVNEFTGASAYQMAKEEYEKQRSFYGIIHTGDARRYIEAPYIPEKLSKEIRDYYLANAAEPLKDLSFDQTNRAMRLNNYLEEVPEINFHLIQEKTAWQQVQLLFAGYGPLLFCAAVIFLVSDIVTRERQEKTQKAGIPYKWNRYLLVQSLAAFTFAVLTLFAFLVLFWGLTGLMFGFGSLSLKVPHYVYSRDYVTNDDVFRLMTIKDFLIRTLPFLLLFLFLMIRIGVLSSLWFKNDVVVLAAGIFTVLFEKLYFDRRMQSLLGMPLGYFPQTYLEYGKVVSGEKNFLLNTDSISIQRGLVVLGVFLVLIEGSIWVSTKFQTRQVYIDQGGRT